MASLMPSPLLQRLHGILGIQGQLPHPHPQEENPLALLTAALGSLGHQPGENFQPHQAGASTVDGRHVGDLLHGGGQSFQAGARSIDGAPIAVPPHATGLGADPRHAAGLLPGGGGGLAGLLPGGFQPHPHPGPVMEGQGGDIHWFGPGGSGVYPAQGPTGSHGERYTTPIRRRPALAQAVAGLGLGNHPAGNAAMHPYGAV